MKFLYSNKLEKNNKISDKDLESLVKKAQKGDLEAFGKIYDNLVDSLYRYVFYKVDDKDEIEDILESLFLKVWQNLKKYKEQKGLYFKAWVFRIAHNLVIDYYRTYREHASLDPRFSDNSKESDPTVLTRQTLNNEFLKEAMEKLKKKHQQIIIYKFINDFSNKEIAQILKKSEGSVRIMQFRALKALKIELQQMGIKEI